MKLSTDVTLGLRTPGFGSSRDFMGIGIWNPSFVKEDGSTHRVALGDVMALSRLPEYATGDAPFGVVLDPKDLVSVSAGGRTVWEQGSTEGVELEAPLEIHLAENDGDGDFRLRLQGLLETLGFRSVQEVA